MCCDFTQEHSESREEQAVQANLCEFGHSTLCLRHCHAMDDTVQELAAIMQLLHSYGTSWLMQ